MYFRHAQRAAYRTAISAAQILVIIIMFAQIVVRVIDVNDNYPIASVSTLEGATSGSVSTETSASVPENSDAGSFVAHISVDDADTGPAGQVSSHDQRWNTVSDTDPRPDPTRDASDP